MTQLQMPRRERLSQTAPGQLLAQGESSRTLTPRADVPVPSTEQAQAITPSQVTGLRRVTYIGIAFGFLGLGFLGAFLPGLPTTPFLLLTSYFLVRSSPRLHAKVLKMPIVGRFLADWREKRGIRPRVKVLAFVIVLAVLAISLSVSLLPTFAKVTIASLGAIGLTVIYRLPTIKV